MKYTLLLLISIPAIAIPPKIHLHTLNALTIRTAGSSHPQYKVASLDQIVRYINALNEVPYRAHLEINNQLYTLYRGIHISEHDHTVFIFSRGYAKTNIPGTNDNFIQRGACITAAYTQLKDAIVYNTPIVSFDYDDSKEGFSFGQTNAIHALQTIYNAVLEKNAAANIVLIGDCHGAKVALEIATRYPKNLKALILMAPFISAHDLTNMIADHYLSYLPFSRPLLHNFFKFYFPQYNEKKDLLEKRLPRVLPDLPILIAHRESDTLISMETIKKLESTLKETGNTKIHVLIIKDKTYLHSKLTGHQEVQQAIHGFLKQYGLPYNEKILKNSVI
jgi:dienelactone hydrolase